MNILVLLIVILDILGWAVNTPQFAEQCHIPSVFKGNFLEFCTGRRELVDDAH
jgi:hypothetical protein